MTANEPLSHDDLRAALPEQALEILDGRTRAEVLAHVEVCASCAEELEQYTETADALVHLAPGIEPPVGFESRIVEQIRATTVPRIASKRRRVPVLVGIAASVLLAFGIGWVAHAATTSPAVGASGHVAERTLVGESGVVGSAYVYTGSPSWMFVTVSLPGAPTSVRCTVEDHDGHRVALGTFTLVSGRGAWAAPLPVPFSAVRDVELSTPNGAVVASLGSSSWSDPSASHSRVGAIPSGA